MMCFRDMTFCASDCTNAKCRRHFGDDDRAAARAWGATFGHEEDPPVAFTDFSGDCPDYEAPDASD